MEDVEGCKKDCADESVLGISLSTVGARCNYLFSLIVGLDLFFVSW